MYNMKYIYLISQNTFDVYCQACIHSPFHQKISFTLVVAISIFFACVCGNLIFWTACQKSFCFYSCKSNLNRIPPTRFSTPDRFLTDNWNIWPRLTRTSTTTEVQLYFSLTWFSSRLSLSLIFVWDSLSLVNFTPRSTGCPK